MRKGKSSFRCGFHQYKKPKTNPKQTNKKERMFTKSSQCNVTFDVIKTFGKCLNHARGVENTCPNKRQNHDTVVSQESDCQNLFLGFGEHWHFGLNLPASYFQCEFHMAVHNSRWLQTKPMLASLSIPYSSYDLLLVKFFQSWNCCWPLLAQGRRKHQEMDAF